MSYSELVRTQAELDRALADGVDWIEIRSERGVWLSVHASGSATVHASGSATVTAYDSATVHAYGSATVRAYDSATVHAYDSATVHAYDSATVTAGTRTAVHLHSARVNLTGGVVIDHTKVNHTNPREWCDYHGVTVTRGIATVYKAVDDNWTTPRGTSYAPGEKPTAPDWNPNNDCGGGLHFGPTPHHALAYHPEATRFVAVGVRLSELRPITFGTAKCKAPRVVRACKQVNEFGEEI